MKNKHNHGMDGPCSCGSGSVVLDTRAQPNGEIWRRRKCKKCLSVFTTLEYHCDTSGYVGEQRERAPAQRHPKQGQPRKKPVKVALPPVSRKIEKPAEKLPLEYQPSVIERIQRMREQKEMENDDVF